MALEILATLEKAAVDYMLSYPEHIVGTAELVLSVQGLFFQVWGRWRTSIGAGSDGGALNSGSGESSGSSDKEAHLEGSKDL